MLKTQLFKLAAARKRLGGGGGGAGIAWLLKMYGAGNLDTLSAGSLAANGDILVGGVSRPNTSNNYALAARISPTGSVVWQRFVETAATNSNDSYGGDIFEREDGIIYTAGTIHPGTFIEAAIGRLTGATGVTESVAVANTSLPLQLYGGCRAPNGENQDVIGVGLYNSTNGLIFSNDYLGVRKWGFRWSTSTTYLRGAILPSAISGSAIVVGERRTATGGPRFMRLNAATGGVTWSKGLVTVGGSCAANHCCDAGDGLNFYAIGWIDVAGGFGGSTDCYLAKISFDGALVWARRFGVNGANFGRGVFLGPDGEVYAIAGSDGLGYTHATMLLRYSSAGALEWQRVIAGNGVPTSSLAGYRGMVTLDGDVVLPFHAIGTHDASYRGYVFRMGDRANPFTGVLGGIVVTDTGVSDAAWTPTLSDVTEGSTTSIGSSTTRIVTNLAGDMSTALVSP